MYKALLACCLPVFLFACSQRQYVRPDTYLIPEDFSFRYKQTLTEDKREDDLRYLRSAMELGYIGEYILERDHFWRFNDAMNELDSRRFENTIAFCDGLGDAFHKLPDMRLMAKLDNRLCGKERWKSFLPTVGENLAANLPDNQGIWYIGRRNIMGYDVGLVSIQNFDFHKFAVWNSFLDRVKDVFASELIIVDLRGAKGNDPTAAKVLTQSLVGGTVSTGLDREIVLRSPHTYAMIANRWQLDIRALKSGQRKVPPLYSTMQSRFSRRARSLEEEEKKLFDNSNTVSKSTYAKRYLQSNEQENIKYNDYRNLPFPSWIFILIDGACRSACEEAVLMLKTHPLARTIGKPTAGSFQFDRVGAVVLPNSKVEVFIPTRYFRLEGKEDHEVSRGITPDLLVEDGKDAMEAAVNEAIHHFL